jgi:hypothetical protein
MPQAVVPDPKGIAAIRNYEKGNGLRWRLFPYVTVRQEAVPNPSKRSSYDQNWIDRSSGDAGSRRRSRWSSDLGTLRFSRRGWDANQVLG